MEGRVWEEGGRERCSGRLAEEIQTRRLNVMRKKGVEVFKNYEDSPR